MSVSIKEIGDCCIVAVNSVWLPGFYKSKQAAQYAARFQAAELDKLQREANQRAGGVGGTITYADLKHAHVG